MVHVIRPHCAFTNTWPHKTKSIVYVCAISIVSTAISFQRVNSLSINIQPKNTTICISFHFNKPNTKYNKSFSAFCLYFHEHSILTYKRYAYTTYVNCLFARRNHSKSLTVYKFPCDVCIFIRSHAVQKCTIRSNYWQGKNLKY